MQNNEVGKLSEELVLESFEGEALDVRFYAPYLLSGLQAFGDKQLAFHLQGPAKPIIFESTQEGNHFLYLVMPVSPTNLN